MRLWLFIVILVLSGVVGVCTVAIMVNQSYRNGLVHGYNTCQLEHDLGKSI